MLARFDHFVDERNQGDMSKETWELLFESADPGSIILQMDEQAHRLLSTFPDDVRDTTLGSSKFHKGIMGGILATVREMMHDL